MFLLWELNGATLPTFLVGGFLVFVGLEQWRASHELHKDSTLDEREYREQERRVQIRLTLSGLFVLTGFLISLGGRLDGLFRKSASLYITFAMGFLGVLLMLLAAIVVWGLVDLSLTAAQLRRSGSRGRGLRQQVEEELSRYRESRQTQRNSTASLGDAANALPSDASNESTGNLTDQS